MPGPTGSRDVALASVPEGGSIAPEPGTLFRKLVDHAPISLVLIDDERQVLYLNPHGERLLGRSFQEIKRGDLPMLHPEDEDSAFGLVDGLLRSNGEAASGEGPAEHRLQLADGGVRWLRWRAARLPASQPPRVVAVAEDVTERHALESVLHACGSVVDNAAAALALCRRASGGGCRLYWTNRNFAQLLGRTREELVDAPVTLVLEGTDPTCPGSAEIRRAIGEARALRTETVLVRPDRSPFDASFEVVPITVGQSSSEDFALIIVDITASKQAQSFLRQQDRLAAVGRLSAGIAHELNNPLGTILLCADRALARAGEDDVLRGCLEDLLIEAQRCADSIHRIGELVRGAQASPERCDIGSLVRDAARAVADSGRHAARLEVSVEQPLPELSLDRSAVTQAVVNVLQNAIEASPTGEIVVVSAERFDDMVHVTVRDSGEGLTGEELANIFDPFFTSRKGAARAGLGLSVAHRIVSDHSGRIEVESAPGQGTVATIQLPVADDVG